MSKTIINLLDSMTIEGISLAALLIPEKAYLEEQRFQGLYLYALSTSKEYTSEEVDSRKTIRLIRGGEKWETRIYGYRHKGDLLKGGWWLSKSSQYE